MTLIYMNGRSYGLVTLDQLTLDEAMVVWDYTQLSLDQIIESDSPHPGVIAALIHVSVARGEPDEKPAAIRKAVGAIPIVELEQVLADVTDDTEDDALPPPSADAGATSSNGSSGTSGEPSAPTGEPPPVFSQDDSSGSPGSATGTASAPTTSAA